MLMSKVIKVLFDGPFMWIPIVEHVVSRVLLVFLSSKMKFLKANLLDLYSRNSHKVTQKLSTNPIRFIFKISIQLCP